MFAEKKQSIIYAIFSILISSICITINSKLSFLYAFHDVDDVHCFITTARCMLRGDVLYRDVYEHKGPMHYFLYCLGISIGKGTLFGVYLIELILFAIFILIVIKTIRLFMKPGIMNYILASAVAIWATVTKDFTAGGQCEELTLPFIALSIYIALALNKKSPDCLDGSKLQENTGIRSFLVAKHIDINSFGNVLIGFCFAMVFWSKYTLTGGFVGYALAVVIIGILNKNYKRIFKSGLMFICGALIGSLPVIIYFGITGAFSDLWEVYFYNLIFKYSQTELGTSGIIGNLKNIMCSWMIIAFVGTLAAPSKMLTRDVKIAFAFMYIFEVLGLASGKMWSYSYEALYVFNIFTFIGVIGIVKRITSVKKISVVLGKLKSSFSEKLREELSKNTRIQHILEMTKAVYSSDYKGKTIVSGKKRLSLRILSGILVFVYMCYLVVTVSMSAYYLKYKEEDYVRYQMSRMILDKVPENPVILCFTSLDPGLYYLTGTYPPDKYFCRYNLFTPEELGYYEKYLKTGIADYIIAYKRVEGLDEYGYGLAMEAESVKTITEYNTLNFYLYAREDLL